MSALWASAFGCALLAACAQGNATNDDGVDLSYSALGSPVDSIKSSIVSKDIAIGLPAAILAAGGQIVVSDAAGQPFIHVLDADSAVRRVSFGLRGEGPGEFGSDPLVLRVDSTNVAFFDLFRQVMSTYDLRELSRRLGDRKPVSSFRPSTIGLTDIQWMPNHRFWGFTWNVDSGEAIVEFDSLGKAIRTVSFVAPADERVALRDRIRAYQAQLCANPSKTLVALVYRYAGRAEIRDTVGAIVAEAQVPFKFRPFYALNPLLRKRSFKNGEAGVRNGYLGCAGSSTSFLALFSGQVNEGRGGKAIDETYVHEFSWDGRLLRVIRLDHLAYYIALSSDGRLLFTTSIDAEGATGSIRRTELHGHGAMPNADQRSLKAQPSGGS